MSAQPVKPELSFHKKLSDEFRAHRYGHLSRAFFAACGFLHNLSLPETLPPSERKHVKLWPDYPQNAAPVNACGTVLGQSISPASKL